MAQRKPIAKARRLRRDATRSERIVWAALRQRPGGLKFRRQHPVGRFIADFACPEVWLIIELDGSGHADPVTQAYDERRTRWLQAQGWSVIRFWNPNDCGETDGLVDAVLAHAGRS
ncbi:endonuclease domain-containing protein [Maricaulaceae bacterium MS644]